MPIGAAIREIALPRARFPPNRFPMAFAQVVEDDDSFSSANELTNGMRADVAGSAGDEK